MDIAYPRDGKGADVASFLVKDRDFGTAWAHRPPILFQLYPGQNRVAVRPQGVLMDGNRVMLDPYDHPIRDFPELPLTLSSKEKGMWIEYYMRQNKEIKPYDLMGTYSPLDHWNTADNVFIARMGKSVSGNAVRIYTLNERATKFRNTAACLSWGEKTGSAEKKAYILGLLPEGATDTRSLGKDLNKQQQGELVAANKGQFPNRRRKAKRVLEAQAPMAIPMPNFQPRAPSAGGDFERGSNQTVDESERAPLEEGNGQHIDTDEPVSFDDLSFPGHGGQPGASPMMLRQGLNLAYAANGAPQFLVPSQLDPLQHFPNNGGNLSVLNNLSEHSYAANCLGHFDEFSSFNSAHYGAIHGGQTPAGAKFTAGGARSSAVLQDHGDSLINHPVNPPTQRRKRPRAALAEDEAESFLNQRRKRIRTESPVQAPEDAPTPASFGGEEESLLRFDENGYVIANTAGTQDQGEVLYPADFDEFLRDSQRGEEDAEGEDVEETWDAPVAQDSNDTLRVTPAPLPTQGQKRRRSSSPEDVEEVEEGPKSKRVRKEGDVQTPEGSTATGSEQSEGPARPVNVARGQKRGRGSSESRGDTDASVETPRAKRQRMTPSSDEAGTSFGADSTTTNDKSSDNDATSESSSDQSSDDSDGSEYTPSPYHQTSLKSIARPTTGGKGPYGADGRPLIGGKGKGKGPLKSSRRANMARKAPAKQQ